MTQFFTDLYNLFFPSICQVCEQVLTTNERLICLHCRTDLPLAKLSDITANEVEHIFLGRVPIVFASSLFLYEQQGFAQRLIHRLKYHGQEELSSLLGQWMGAALQQCRRFPQIDYVVPVPLSPKKKKRRGYNQVDGFGIEIAKSIKATFVGQNLSCLHSKDTQTTKNRLERWQHVKDQFYLTDPEQFSNTSVLIVDDVITTGATIEACCRALFKSTNVKISIVTMAFTS